MRGSVHVRIPLEWFTQDHETSLPLRQQFLQCSHFFSKNYAATSEQIDKVGVFLCLSIRLYFFSDVMLLASKLAFLEIYPKTYDSTSSWLSIFGQCHKTVAVHFTWRLALSDPVLYSSSARVLDFCVQYVVSQRRQCRVHCVSIWHHRKVLVPRFAAPCGRCSKISHSRIGNFEKQFITF